jgi:hypothetical protein
MRTKLAAAAVFVVAVLAAPAAASAATLGVLPGKACYRAGESVLLGGGGYTPNSNAQVNLNGRALPGGIVSTSPAGSIAATLTIGDPHGERLNTYNAVDLSNTSNQGVTQLRATSLAVNVKPKNGRPGRVLRIKARGFTTAKTLYVHIIRGHKRLNRRIGKLKGACRKLSVRKKMFSRHTKTGTYTVQFDGKRHYSKKTKVKARFHVNVFAHFASHAAGPSWQRIP